MHYTPPDAIPLEDAPAQAYAREYHGICCELTLLQQRLRGHCAAGQKQQDVDELRAVRLVLQDLLPWKSLT